MNSEVLSKIREIAYSENITISNLSEDLKVKTDYLNFTCNKCHHEGKTTASNLLDTRRKTKICQYCLKLEKFEDALIKKYGRNPYEFISEFKGYNEPITVKCKDCGFEFSEKKASSLLMNSKLPEGKHPCKNCTKLRIQEKKDINDLISSLTKKFGACNYTFPEPEKYMGIHSRTKFKIVCNFCGHEMETYITNILNPKNGKHYCRVCNHKNRLLETMTYKERCLKVSEGKIEPIEDYIDSKTPILHRCNVCGNEWKKIPIKNTLRNAGCPVCTGKSVVSKAETEIEEYIKSLDNTLEIERNNRNILPSGKELDIYIPSKKIAFEHHGLYWHSEKHKGKNGHLEKLLECEKEGIRLVQIFEDEWVYKKDICKEKIKTILGYNTNSIFGRKCTVEDILPSEKNEFFNKYHIQGEDKASIMKCLKYNNEIVAVMTFCKTRKALGNSGADYELSRYASKYHIIGGFSKLFKHIVDENKIDSVITYADLRWSSRNSNVYDKNGFVLKHASKPNYWYFDKNKTPSKREHRYSFRKQVLEKRFPDVYDPKLTEFQIMDKTTYRRIWDCGNLVYEWHRQNN